MILLHGKLKESIFTNKLEYKSEKLLNSFSSSYINDNIGYHSINSIKNSYSLHLYHPKNFKTKYF